MAVPLVLIFALVLSIIGVFVLKSNSQNYQQNRISMNLLRTRYLARAGMEHSLLKVKFLQRELYDAACLAQGRNPLYDFSRSMVDNLYNPGPKYAYRTGEATPNAYGYTADLTAFSGCTSPPASWIDTFRSDITSRGDDNPMLMAPFPNNIRNKLRDPYSGIYEATRVDILTNKVDENTLDNISNTVVIEVLVSTEMNDSRGKSYHQELRRTIRVSRHTSY